MNKIGGKIILWLLILALLVFTMTRTLHFLQMTFPPDLQYVSYLGLAAFDIGILGWLYYAMHSAEGASQRAVAYGMIFIYMAGVMATTIADMIIVSSQNGLTKLPPQWGTIGLWAVIIVIVLNIFAGILVHLVDPKHQRTMAMENARDTIHSRTISEIKQQADMIAPRIAQAYAQHWAQQTMQEMIGSIPNVQIKQLPAKQQTIEAPATASFAQAEDEGLDPHGVVPEVEASRKELRTIETIEPEEGPKTEPIEQVAVRETRGKARTKKTMDTVGD